jgi:hypothetical protein
MGILRLREVKIQLSFGVGIQGLVPKLPQDQNLRTFMSLI